jgi:hypothetical protein
MILVEVALVGMLVLGISVAGRLPCRGQSPKYFLTDSMALAVFYIAHDGQDQALGPVVRSVESDEVFARQALKQSGLLIERGSVERVAWDKARS